MLDLTKYTTTQSAWTGIIHYVNDHPAIYAKHRSGAFTDDQLLKIIKKQAQETLGKGKDYDSFRKAITALCKGNAVSIKKENLFRLLFVLGLQSDTEAQDLLMNYLHQSELSARSLDEFIMIAALKLHFTWEETCQVREHYALKIASQPLSPSEIVEGQTAEVYYSVICDQLHSLEDLYAYLDVPENMAFFAMTCNTRYLALFDDVTLETLYTGDHEQHIRMYTNYGALEQESIKEYYYNLYNLSEKEVTALAKIFDNVFMSYDNFCLLVQRRRPVNISSGLFLLGLFKKLLTDEEEDGEDFYVDFLDSEDFEAVINDILAYFGFPMLNPELDPFERLILDTYYECLDQHSDLSNAEFQQEFIDRLMSYLACLAKNSSGEVL